MTHKVHVTPGSEIRVQAKAGIVVVIFFLLFGLVFGFVVSQDTPKSESGLRLLQGAFMILWIVGCFAMIFSYARLLSGHKKPSDNSLLDLHLEEADSAGAPVHNSDFADRLRKLEALKAEGLVSESEYHNKRKKILQEKW